MSEFANRPTMDGPNAANKYSGHPIVIVSLRRNSNK